MTPAVSDGFSPLTRNVRRTVLPNGLTILTKEVHTHPIVAAMIWYRVGSRNEELGQTGKSHFLEHMMFKGTERLGKGEIDLQTLVRGGRNNAFTWLDFTAYYFTFASDRWELALEIEADRIRNTAFAPEEFESEKQVIIEELQMGLDSPFEVLENEVWATAFRQHPYHAPTVGWLKDVQDVTVGEMKDYYDRWYHPRNATVVLVGDFATDAAIARVTECFGQMPAGPVTPPMKIVEPLQKGEKRVVVKKSTPVERLMIAYHAPEVAHSDSYALHVASMLLSHGRTSRLYQRLQEKDQSVTFAFAQYSEHIDPSLFYIQAELKPGRKAAEVEAAILEEIDRLAHEPIPEAELEKAKRQIRATYILGNEDMLNQATLLGEYETIANRPELPDDERGFRYLDAYLKRTQAMTTSEIQAMVRKYLHADNRTIGHLVNEDRATTEPTIPTGDEEAAA
ncbi:MAG: insulinase family protein [Blastocatellia bacterium]|nr:insulinase family protein [Blastocatellia bacterium]